MKQVFVISAILVTFMLGAQTVAAVGDAIGELIGDMLEPEAANRNMTTNSASANCNGVSDLGHHPSDTVPGTGASYHFLTPVTYTDCSWTSDPLSVYFSAYGFQGGMTCATTEHSFSIQDNIFDNSLSFTQDIGGCLRYCNQWGYAQTHHTTSNTRAAGSSYGSATINKGC